MPANVDPNTGIAYGVIDARKVPYIYENILDHGTNESLKYAVNEVKDHLRNNLIEFDAATAFEAIVVSDDEDEDDVLRKKVQILTTMLDDTIRFATELKGLDTASAVEAALDVVDFESGTFEIEEVVDAILDDMNQREYFTSGDGEHRHTYNDGGFEYILDYLGGAPLIWVTKSPFATYCRTCSPCVPNAGDLDNCGVMEDSNNIAYCPDPEEFSVLADRPEEVFTVDTATGDLGGVYFKKETT